MENMRQYTRKRKHIIIPTVVVILAVVLIYQFILTNTSIFKPSYNVVEASKFGSVKPPLYNSSFFNASIVTFSTCSLHGKFVHSPFPLIKGEQIVKDETENMQYKNAWHFKVENNETSQVLEYLVLADSDSILYEPGNPDTKLGFRPLSSYNTTSSYTLEGYSFNYTIEGETYNVLRPLWIGNVKQYTLIETARGHLAELVGEEYQRENFVVMPAYFGYQVRDVPDRSWKYTIMFCYRISIDDYLAEREVRVHFNSSKGYVGTSRAPPIDNLMPFKVSMTQAISIGIAAGLPSRPYIFEADIYFWEKLHRSKMRIERYVWVVNAWDRKPNTNGASAFTAYIDVHTGKVYGLERFSVHVGS